MTFIEVLEAHREDVEAIEDVLSSLQGKENDTTLQGCLTSLIAQLEKKSGYRYVL